MTAQYDAFISSSAWRRSPARLQELKAAGYRCRLCNAGGKTVRLEVHHRTYARLGRERPSDLVTLCTTCHRVVTAHRRQIHYARRRPQVTDVRQLIEDRVLVDSNAEAA